MAIRYNEAIVTTGEEATEALGADLALELSGGSVVALCGDLGAGKTVISRGIARALGVTEPVSSPTFPIVQEYPLGKLMLYHMDMYRLQGAHDAIAFGVEDYFNDAEGISIVEWAERIQGILPLPHLRVQLKRRLGEEREITITRVV